MKKLRIGTITLALLSSVGLVVAAGSTVLAQAVNPGAGSAKGTTQGTTADQQQTQTGAVSFSADQRQMIFSRMTVQAQTAPAGFALSVGATVPAGVTLQPVPQTVVTDLPQVQRYHYAMIGERMVFVDPANRQVVAVIER